MRFRKKFFFWVFLTFINLGLLFFEMPSEAEDFSLVLPISEVIVFQENTLFPFSNLFNAKPKIAFKIPAIITAYSSTPWETDGDPHITAAGTKVRDGIVANNYLPLGTRIIIPEIFGEKIFIVEDRMNWRKSNYQFDVWFENYWQALNFGTKKTYVEVLE